MFSFPANRLMMKAKGGGVEMEATFGLVPILIMALIAVVIILMYFFFHHWAK
jgi:hypothetical protein